MSSPLRAALDAAVRAGVSACDVQLVTDDELEAEVRAGAVDRMVRASGRVLSLRALRSGRVGCASSSDLTPEAIRALVERACELADAAPADEFAGLPVESAQDCPELELYCAETAALEPPEAIELAHEADSAARALDPRIRASGQARCSVHSAEVTFARSDGFEGSFQRSSIHLSCVPLAEAEGEKQREYWVRSARSRRELPPAAEVGRIAAERALRRLGASKVPSVRASVIYEARTATTLVSHLAAAALGDAIAERRSFLAGRVGEPVAAPAITITDDARLRGRLASRPFDGEGTATRRNVLVDRGVLRGYLLDTRNARRLGLAPTGSARRPARGLPAPGSSNLLLEPGQESPDDIIAKTERGLLVSELIGFGVNLVTGDYSRGAAGFWIEDGRIRHPVQEVTVAGNLLEMLRTIDAVGNDLDFFGYIAAPTLRIREATIAGL